MDLQELYRKYKSKEGWLQKKSSNRIIGFQKRYFSIGEDNGVLYLLYDKNPTSKDKKPKGAIQISQIEIDSKENSKDFTLKYPGRDFIIRALTEEIKNDWVNTLKFLKSYSIQQKGQVNNPPQFEKEWKFERLDSDKKLNIRLNLETKNNSADQKQIQVKDEEMQKIKGIYEYLQNYSQDILQNHVIQGFLFIKKVKAHKKFSQPKLNWFFLFSRFSLSDNKEIQSDVDFSHLPSFIKPDILYYYRPELDNTPKRGEIHINDIKSIRKINTDKDNILKKSFDRFGNQVISAMNKFAEITKLDKAGVHINQFDHPFQIVSKKDNKEITHNFYSESLLQIDKWFKSLQKIQVLHENQESSINESVRNLFKIQIHQPNEANDTSATSFQNRPELNFKQARSQSNSEDENDDNNKIEKYGQKSEKVFQTHIKIKAKDNILKIWKDRIVILKRQIIQFFNNERDLIKGIQEDDILINDIQKINFEKDHSKFTIQTKNNEIIKFKFKHVQEASLWKSAISKLMQDEDISIEILRIDPTAVPLQWIQDQEQTEENHQNNQFDEKNNEQHQEVKKSQNEYIPQDKQKLNEEQNLHNAQRLQDDQQLHEVKKSHSQQTQIDKNIQQVEQNYQDELKQKEENEKRQEQQRVLQKEKSYQDEMKQQDEIKQQPEKKLKNEYKSPDENLYVKKMGEQDESKLNVTECDNLQMNRSTASQESNLPNLEDFFHEKEIKQQQQATKPIQKNCCIAPREQYQQQQEIEDNEENNNSLKRELIPS